MVPGAEGHVLTSFPCHLILMMQDIGVHMKGGVITERDSNFCTLRIRLPAGVITTAQSGESLILPKNTKRKWCT